MVRRYRSGWWLERKYWDEGWTQAEIAEECGVAVQTIRRWMRRRGVETRDLVGENHPLYGVDRPDEVRKKISESLKGRQFSDETVDQFRRAKEGRELPEETRRKISNALSGLSRPMSTRRKMSEARTGEKNPRWKGGGSGSYGPGWNAARRRVHERDGVCQFCEHNGEDQRLEVHHIVPVRLFKQAEEVTVAEAHKLGNFVLLCRKCHHRAEAGKIEFESTLEPPGDERKE